MQNEHSVIESGHTPSCPDDAWLRDQRARIEQRHLQFGRHCRLDIGRLLMRMAERVKAPLAELEMGREDGATDPVQRLTLETADHSLPPEVHCNAPAFERSPTRPVMPHARAPNCFIVPGPATLGDFVPSYRANDFSCREWVATLADRTTVVVNDWRDSPSVVGVEKAMSIVQSRAYLEHRARRLLLPVTKEAGSWRLVTIDFGTEARRQGCEFLMCFVFRATTGVLSITSPSVDIGFALPLPADMDPIFVLTIVGAAGFPA